MFYVKSQNNHKENNCRRFRKENEKRIKACHYKKINKAHSKISAEENQDKNAAGQTGSNKQKDKSKFFPISYHLKCKSIKLFNQNPTL